jgi:hypothetical protein
LWCFNEEGDGSLLPLPFFSSGVEAKKATIACCHCLFICLRKEEEDDNVLSFSMVLLQQRRQR